MPATNARAIDVANAAVTVLTANQGGFAQTFTPARDYIPLFPLEQAKLTAGVYVTVIPAVLDEESLSRLSVQGIVAIDVGVQKYAPDLATRDQMMLLAEQVKTVMEKGLVLPEAAIDCGWQRTENDPLYSTEHLIKFGVFTTLPRFFYLTRRAR